MSFRYPVSPNLREFLYDVLYKLQGSDEFFKRDTYKELGRTNSKARQFANKATLEQILYIVGMCGIEWTLVIFDNDKRPRYIRQLFERYRDEGVHSDNAEIKKLIEKKIYITTDKQFVKYLGVAADLIEFDGYKRSAELSRAGYHLRQWQRKFKSATASADEDDAYSMRYLQKLALSTIIAESTQRLTQVDGRVLGFLYIFDTVFVQKSAIGKRLAGIYTMVGISSALKRLVKAGLVQEDFKDKKAFKITALGVAEVNRNLGAALNQTSFF